MSKSIRGGVPICFPQFGRTSDKVSPQHGWARLNPWTVASETPTSVTLTISSVSPSCTSGRPDDGHWPANSTCPFAVTLSLTVTLTSTGSLDYSLKITNDLDTTAPYQCLLHNYFQFDFSKDQIEGLENYSCIDTQPRGSEGTGMSYFTQGPDPITLDGEVDRIFHPPQDKPSVLVKLKSSSKTCTISCSAKSGSGSIPVSAVVWNPYISKAKGMGDFDDEGYKNMVCIEPGIIDGQRVLLGKEEVVIEQVIEIE
ncbi:hypothetical protein TrST_g5191 [Triparma strigata]|uniref:glucose-6-phosphate 1-epimerase n=1 Tax=Triparma strigata TaxID=1606541 RepID=A0A9W7BUR5_9STRA|nr:hypothetical protein TrST_g5191 [Triparma strigata]